MKGVVSGREMVVKLGVLEGGKGYKAGRRTRVELAKPLMLFELPVEAALPSQST